MKTLQLLSHMPLHKRTLSSERELDEDAGANTHSPYNVEGFPFLHTLPSI